jgi:hypothetical protein
LPMMDEVYKEFFRDRQTERAFKDSEVWDIYSRYEMANDRAREKRAMEEKLDRENEVMRDVEQFRQKVASDPKLKAYFQKVAALLEQQPELRAKVDPKFLAGLELLDLD